jgi:hypothetical protein
MKRLFLLVLAGVLALPALPAGGAARAEDARLFVGGGTNLTSGYFFPGTGIYDGAKYQYFAPLQVTQGSNVVLTNGDESLVTNKHQVRSLKKTKRTKRPLFTSKPLYRPGDMTTIITSHLKPGQYKYICTTHSTMSGVIEVVPG